MEESLALEPLTCYMPPNNTFLKDDSAQTIPSAAFVLKMTTGLLLPCGMQSFLLPVYVCQIPFLAVAS